MKKSHVRRDLEDKFNCDAKLYFELLQEPIRNPKFKYLGKMLSRMTPRWMNSSSARPKPGGGMVARINNSSSGDESSFSDEDVTGTLTMFCTNNNEHYALTCFHVCCATGETGFNMAFNKPENIQAIRRSLHGYVQRAKELEYCYKRKDAENNEYTPLGDFHKYHFDSKCDIMSVKIPTNTKIKCEMMGVPSPNWENIGKEIYEKVYKRHDTVNVEKNGFSSGVSFGQIVPCDFSYKLGEELLFQDAYAIKRCSSGGSFLVDGDSGSPIFLVDQFDENKKEIFAYGVCEVDQLSIIKRHEPNHESEQVTTPVQDDCDMNSIWSEDEDDDSNVEMKSGEYSLCLKLDTALENLDLHEAVCVSECSLKRQETRRQGQT